MSNDRLGELSARSQEYDALVDATPDLDRFCSATDWTVPAQLAFGDGPVTVAWDEGAAVALSRVRAAWGGYVLTGLDPVWGYARPAVGPSAGRSAGLLAAVVGGGTASGRRRWDAVAVTGVVPGGPFAAAAAEALGRRHRVRWGPGIDRHLARLDGGVPAFLARRSARFRRNLRRAARAAASAGVDFEWSADGGAEVVDRAVAVERRSWKGQVGSGLAEDRFASFYRQLAGRLAPEGRLRAGFATAGGRDVAYILGAVRGPLYRGLQLSYDEDFGPLSLGNLLQIGQMERLAAQGVTRYDLGMSMAYKQSWTDEVLSTRTLVVLP